MPHRQQCKVFVPHPSRFADLNTQDDQLRAQITDGLLRRGNIEEIQQLLSEILAPANEPKYNEEMKRHSLAILDENQGQISIDELGMEVLSRLRQGNQLPREAIDAQIRTKLSLMLKDVVDLGTDYEDRNPTSSSN